MSIPILAPRPPIISYKVRYFDGDKNDEKWAEFQSALFGLGYRWAHKHWEETIPRPRLTTYEDIFIYLDGNTMTWGCSVEKFVEEPGTWVKYESVMRGYLEELPKKVRVFGEKGLLRKYKKAGAS